jgi:murein DD-endopeptidase MepM/ murein hydrolase activator NlpD
VLARIALIAGLLCGSFGPTPVMHAQDNTPVPATGGAPTYTVQAGDTLFGIARQFGVTLEALQAANPNVEATGLQIGAVLIIPGFGDVSGTLLTHPLEPGESLDSLGLRFGMKRETLIRLNRILNPDQLYINQPIVLPERGDEGDAAPTGTMLTVRPNTGLLSAAAAHNQNPWAVAAANRLSQPGLMPPAASLVLPGGDSVIKALPAPLTDIQLPQPAVQGRTLVVRIVAQQPVTLTGALGEWPLNFVADPANAKVQIALLGIYRLADPSLYPLAITVTTGEGATARFEQSVPVRAGVYATDPPLTVNPATLDPATVQPEFERVKALISQVTPDKLWEGLFALPSVGVIRSRFGSLRSYNGGPYDSFHGGTDFSGGEDRPITAPAPGVVVLAEPLVVRGGATIIDHGWGVYTGYWHQSQILVKMGDRVETGQILGYNGATGRVTGPHLHWEVWVGGFQVEPLDWTETVYP